MKWTDFFHSPKKSLRMRFFLSYLALIVILTGSLLAGISYFLQRGNLDAKGEQLLARGQELAVEIQEYQRRTGSLAGVSSLLGNLEQYMGAQVWLLDRTQRILAASSEYAEWDGDLSAENGMGYGRMQRMHGLHHGSTSQGGGMAAHACVGKQLQELGNLDELHASFVASAKEGERWTRLFDSSFSGEKMLLASVPLEDGQGTRIGSLLLQMPVADIEAAMAPIYRYLMLAGLAAVGFALLLAGALSHQIVEPLLAMELGARSIAQGDYGVRVPAASLDEIGQLGRSMNEMAQALGNYVAKLKRMERQQREFTSNVSHELRTPLTILRGYDEMLLDGAVEQEAERKRYYGLIHAEILRLQRLINDLLDLARMEAGRTALEMESLQLPEVLHHVMGMLRKRAEEKGVSWELRISDTQFAMHGNGDRIVQLFLIFLDNALKYTEMGGSVTVSLHRESSHAVVEIKDTGKGIPAEDIPHLWERFYKVEKSHTRDDSGSGLGMAIASEIMAAHRIEGAVESEPGKGTRIRLLIPLADESLDGNV